MLFIPPRLAEAMLHRVLPPDDAEVITGDLEEIARATVVAQRGIRAARRWYWRQAFSIAAAHMLKTPHDTSELQLKRTTMAAVRQDFSYALRSLRKQPAFTAVAVLMLGVGIGANVAIFALVNAVLFKPLPFAEPDRLMLVHLLGPEIDGPPEVFRTMIWSYPKYEVFREHQRTFESTAAFGSYSWNVTGAGVPERLIGELVESTYFGVLGVTPAIGRTFSPQETSQPGSEPLVMLGYGMWTDRFGADPAVVGRSIGLNGVAHTIVGVGPAGFRGLTGQADIWVPLMTLPAADLGEKWNHSYTVVARRKAEISVSQSQAATGVLGGVIDSEIGRPSGEAGPAWSATAVPLDDERADPLIRRSILLLLAAVGAVLLIVCINLANLMLVRALGRQREVAIRLALGASRFRVISQFMTESGVLAVGGAAVGLLVAYAAVSAAAALLPDLRMVLPRGQTAGLTRIGLGRLGLDLTTLTFTWSVAAAAMLLFGLLPAWRATRGDLSTTIKAGSPGTGQGSRGLSGRNLLVVGEMALALVLLTASGLMLKSVARLYATELGFRPDSLLSVRMALPAPQYNAARATQYFEQLLGRLETRSQLQSIAYASCAPLSGPCNMTSASFPDKPAAPRGTVPPVGVVWISPNYFDALGIRLVRGRAFSEHDRVGQPKVVVINETAAKLFWPHEDPIGKRVGLGQGGFQDGAEVVGVAADVRYAAVEASVSPDVYLPLLQSRRTWGVIFVRSGAPAASVVAAVRADVRSLDPDLPLTDIKMMDERFKDATWRTRMSAWLLGVFAGLALLLAALGTYGVMSQGVEQRRSEIGVRMALGAARRDILRLIIGRVLLISTAGILLGLALAVPSMKLLTALLYQVDPRDPWVFTVLAVVLLTVTLLAGYIPARRATRVDPLATLRAE